MRLIVERWIKVRDPYMDELVETIAEQREVKNEDEAKGVAKQFKSDDTTVRVTLHYCYHDEDPTKPCKRVEI